MESKRRLGNYSLVAEIARGATGIVYLAATSDPPVVSTASARSSRPPPSHGRQTLFVVKRLKPELASDAKFRSMFLDEARLAARLVHRNIVHTHDVGEDGERLYLVMEYLEGRTLRSALRLRGARALPVPTVLRIVCNVLAGLHHAHEATDPEGAPLGVVHRDVSAQNVFLTYDGQVKVLDFGVAHAFGRSTQTEPGRLKGRIVGMAPERVTDVPADRRADVFSVGALLREAVTELPLWEGTELEILRDLAAKKIPPFPDDVAISKELRAILEQAMAPDREHRFRTAHAMRAAIEQYVIRIDSGGSLATMSDVLQREFGSHRLHAHKVIEDFFAPSLPADLPIFPSSTADIAAAIASSLPPPMTSSAPPEIRIEGLDMFPGMRPPTPSDAGIPLLDDEPDPAPPLFPRVRRPRRRSFVYVGSVGAAVLALGAAFVLRPRPHERVAPVGAPTATMSAVAPADDRIELRVLASPATAQIIVDENVVGAASWTGRFARGTEHAIQVVAAGHIPKTSRITLDSAALVTIQLDPAVVAAPLAGTPVVAGPRLSPRPVVAAAPTPAVSVAPAPAPVVTAAPGDAFGGGQAPQRPIDPKSPYE